MKILVGQHELKIDKKDKVNQNEYKVTKCEFEFDEAITNDLVKIALFTNSAGTYKQYIINNECDIPAEILEKQETTTLGVYAYKEENEELELRYSPEEIKFYVSNGSYKENAENTEPITPTDKEQMEQALQNGLNDINDKIDEVDEKLDGIDTAIEETNNLNLDVSDKVDGDVTVTLTKKDASTKTVVLSDGTSLEFNWDGTKLGIKTSDEEEYTYVDLQGIQGIPGPQGEPFRIKKTYSSVAEMNADFNNMEYGDYVMIASSVEAEDNAKLYTRGESQWIFITDFSGATGIRGPVGATPNIQIGSVTSGSAPSVTRTGTDENPVLNFVLQKGDKGDKGNIGDTGNGISSIEKTSTSGLVDTYTITFTNGNTTTFDVTNGKSIDRIEKTATVGNIDTYTIYFNDNSTSTFEVANGEVTKEELQEEVDRLSMIYNLFPTTSDEDTEMTLDGTGEVKLKKIGLKGNTSQNTTTGKNLFDVSLLPVTKNGVTISLDENENVVLNGTPNITSGYINFQVGKYFRVQPNTYTLSVIEKKVGIGVSTGGFSGRLNITQADTVKSKTSTSINEYDLMPEINVRYDVGALNNFILNPQLEISSTASDYEPYTNGPAPNPDYPQDIHVVSGDNTINVCGRNVVNKEEIKSTYLNNWTTEQVSNGVKVNHLTSYTTGMPETNLNLIPNTNYTFKCSISSTTSQTIPGAILTIEGTNYYINADTIKNFTTGASGEVRLRIGNATDMGANTTYTNIMIVKGTYTSGTMPSYEPYTSSSYQVNLGSMELCKIGDYQDSIKKSTGKNLCNTTFELGGIDTTTGQDGSGTDRVRTKDYVEIKANTTYTLSGVQGSRVVCFYNSSKAYLSYVVVGSQSTSGTFTTPNDTSYIRWYIIQTNTNINEMLNEGYTALPYEPYGKVWYLNKQIGKVVLDGSEAWAKRTTRPFYTLVKSDVMKLSSSYSNATLICNYLQASKPDVIWNLNINGITNLDNSNAIRIRIKDDPYDITTFKQWLGTTKPIVYYVLATPTVTEITDTTLIEQLDNLENAYSYDTQTNITQTNDDMPFILDVEALMSLKNIFNS